MKNFFLIQLLIILGALLLGSNYYYYSPMYNHITKAVATIHPTKGNTASGNLTFTRQRNGLHIVAKFHGLKPGKHGIHIHEYGDCSCPDALCAGSHFNPTNMPHGAPNQINSHVGDLGNIIADEHGNAAYEHIDKLAKLNGPHSIIGRSVIIHMQEDDYITQPTGNAGVRVG